MMVRWYSPSQPSGHRRWSAWLNMPGREGPLIAACNFNMYLCLPIDLVLITCSIKIIALTIEMLSIEKVKCFFFRALKFLMYRKGQLTQTVKCYTVFL